MLEHLDAIDWRSLRHAYGEATDVPELLRCLHSSEPEQRQEAMQALCGSICHQGTVYPATAAAVPFLYELLTSRDASAKSEIAYLLACIADGHGYLEIHAVTEWGRQVWNGILTKQGQSLADEMEREAAEVQQVRQAVSVGLAHLVEYLQDPEPEVRRAVAEAIGHYPEHAAISMPALEAAVASEADEEVCTALRESVERLNQ